MPGGYITDSVNLCPLNDVGPTWEAPAIRDVMYVPRTVLAMWKPGMTLPSSLKTLCLEPWGHEQPSSV